MEVVSPPSLNPLPRPPAYRSPLASYFSFIQTTPNICHQLLRAAGVTRSPYSTPKGGYSLQCGATRPAGSSAIT
ncbi:hypothetical protein E2C01_032515 [Portunus trituberculatus]|uniref:Uncharacterized protein n=1 Tax=Portunus trituberculatus TaxID=210409 RepID=A0A5B7F0X7_PORTR|nr:hypothetical protein [Portunus trituberculatus]